MRPGFLFGILLVMFCSASVTLGQELSEEQLKRLKAATVFIKVQASTEGATGSGFLIQANESEGFIVTNHHVIEPALEPLRTFNRPSTKPRSRVEVVFDSGSPKDRSLPATILSVDPDTDLAVLQVKSASPFPQPLDLKNVPRLRETLPVLICGFPFGDALSQTKNPEITISPATVSAIRMTSTGQVRQIQLTGSLNPGNSGGPVVTSDGKLIGVARATIRSSGIGLAIPQLEVVNMLRGRTGTIQVQSPSEGQYELSAPLIDPMNQLESLTLHVQPARGKLPVSEPDAVATLLPGGQAIPMTLQNGQAKAQVQIMAEGGEPVFRVQLELKTKSGTFFTFPTDVSTRSQPGSGMVRDPGGVRPPMGVNPSELPPWIKDLLEGRVENMPKPTETLPPTAAGTINLSELNLNFKKYDAQSVQVNALTSGNLTERPDGYQLDAHSGSGKTPSNLRLILPKDLACQLNDLAIEPDQSYAIRLLGTMERPKSLAESLFTLRVKELQVLDASSGTSALTFRPETAPSGTKATVSSINRFPSSYVGQNFTFTMVFGGIVTFRNLPEVDLTTGMGAKPLNLDFYCSKAMATQADDELRGGKQIARVSFKVERVSSKTGKGVLGVNKIELLNLRDGKVVKTLSSAEPISYPVEAGASKGPTVSTAKPPTAGKPTTTAPTTPAKVESAKEGTSWALVMILGIAFVFGLVVFVGGLVIYFVFIRKAGDEPGSEEPEPSQPAKVRMPEAKKPESKKPTTNGPDEFPGFG